MLSLMLLTWSALAAPSLLPSGSSAVYGGVGVSTWRWGMSGNRRDPAAIGRVDTWAGHGLGDHLQLTGGVPLVASAIVGSTPHPPCPRASDDDDYCDGVVSLGDAHALLHVGTRWRRVEGRLAAGPRTDVLTAGTRTRYVNVGQGTWGGLLEGSLGVAHQGLSAFVEGRYVARLGRPVDGLPGRYPSDAAQGTVAAAGRSGAFTLQLAVHGHRQLRGVEYGPVYLQRYYDTPERWGVVAFRQVRAEGKLSWATSDRSGVHLTVSRAVHTRNGPHDHADVGLGMHLWFPPPEERRSPTR
jgi:hypothetical protein